MRKLFSLLPLVVCLVAIQLPEGQAQNGDYYLRHFTPDMPHVDQINYAIIEDGWGRIRVANRQGVLSFDGNTWSITRTPGTVLSIKFNPQSKRLYAACSNDIGYIEIDRTGKEQFISIKGGNTISNATDIEILGDKIYFLQHDQLIEYSESQSAIVRKWQKAWAGIFTCSGKLYLSDAQDNYYQVGARDLVKVQPVNMPAASVMFAVPLDNNVTLIGTTDNRLYQFSADIFQEVKPDDQAFINNAELYDAVLTDNNTVILATQKAGCVAMDVKTGKINNTINYYSGLPDNEIYALGKDASGGVWMAHEFGLTRLDYHIPFRCFSNYSGLSGRLEYALSFRDKVYVGTNEGVYLLDAVPQYTPVQSAQASLAPQPLVPIIPADLPAETSAAEETKKKKGFLGGIFGGKKNKETMPAIPNEENKQVRKKVSRTFSIGAAKADAKEVQPQFVKKTIKHAYKKVNGVKGKCLRLVVFQQKLLAATNSGIYEIRGDQSYTIASGNVRHLYASATFNRIYASTSDGRVLCYALNNGNWNALSIFSQWSDPISCIIEDKSQNLWLTGVSSLYKMSINAAHEVKATEELPIDNPYSDDIFAINLNQKIYFSLASRYYYYDPSTHKLVRDQGVELKYAKAERILTSQPDVLWVFNKRMWECVSDKVTSHPNYLFLSLFHNADEVIYDEARKTCWLISRDNQLYALDLQKNYSIYNKPTLFIRDIVKSDGANLYTDRFSIKQFDGSLIMNMISPDFYDRNTLEYQYKIEGLSDEWTDWSSNNSIVLSYLAAGDYNLLIRSRNALGQITEKNAVQFTISPPYWLTWWFYAGEVLFFGILWMISYRLTRQGNHDSLLTKLLTFITLVVTVEFLSTVAENMISINISPVINFGVKVAIAMSLFPIERFLVGFIKKKEVETKPAEELTS